MRREGQSRGGRSLLEAAAGARTDASLEARWLAERIVNSGVFRSQIGLFSGRGLRDRTLSYAHLDRWERRTLAVAEAKIEVGENCEDE